MRSLSGAIKKDGHDEMVRGRQAADMYLGRQMAVAVVSESRDE